jgi:hypothetical protein
MADPTGHQTDWPITVVARWKDPGYSERELRWRVAVLIAWLWMGGTTFVLERHVDPRVVLFAVLLAAWVGWPLIRRHPAELELVLEPDRLRFRDIAAGTPTVNVARRDAGTLLVGESGLDWRVRAVLVTDVSGRELLRFRAGNAAVQFRNADGTSESWWRSNMPPNTNVLTPPSILSATALLGAWWPQPDQRWSVRGSYNVRRSWSEGGLSNYASWDARQRQHNSFLLGGGLLFVYALAIVTTWPFTASEAIAYLLPGFVGLALAIRGVLGSSKEEA